MSVSVGRLEEMAAKIEELHKLADELKQLAGDDFETVRRNASRILANIKILEINVVEVIKELR